MIRPPSPLPSQNFGPGARLAMLVIALCALLAAPVAETSARQQDQPKQGEDQPGARPDETPPTGEPDQPSPDENQDSSQIRRAWNLLRGGDRQPDAQDDAGVARPNPPATPPRRVIAPGTQDAAQAAAPQAPPDPEEVFEFPAFAEPVQIGSLIDWVSLRLGVNIFSDPGVTERTVVFNGPLRVKAKDLLNLLGLLVEQQGFALTKEREGWYTIRAAGNVPVNLGDEPLSTTRIIPTPLLRPSALQNALSAATGGAGGGTNATVSFVDDLGIIIVTATPRTIRSIEEIVDALVAEQSSQVFHRIEVAHISASVARAKAIELNSQPGAAGLRGRAANPNQPIGQPVAAAGAAAGSTLSNLADRLFVDEESNSLIFRGSDEEAAQFRDLIAVLDTPSRLIARRYPAGPASPDIAAYGERRGLGPVSQSAFGGSGSAFGSRSFGSSRTTGTDSSGTGGALGGSGFVLEPSQEAFVYFGTASQHDQVEELVRSFADHAREARIVVEFYRLKYADAENVAEILTALVEQTQEQFQDSPFLPGSSTAQRRQTQEPQTMSDAGAEDATAAGDATSVSLTPNEDIAIEADTARNQVIVRAPVRQQTEFARIISRLDIRRPQVYVEAKIVAVTATDDFRLAFESQFSPGNSVIFTNFGLTTAPEGGSATDPRNVATGLQGLTAAIIKSDYVPIVINALQTVGDAKIVSTPRLLVKDNEEANLESVREEPYSTTTQNASTTATGQGGTATAGTTLSVTPQIGEGDMVNLSYSIELSAFDRSATQQAGLQPPKQTENYESVVALPSDSTMVIGGLTFDTDQDTVRKVPFLGDIPIIGQLFRDQTYSRTTRTIYVFIRVVVLRDESSADLRLLTKGPMSEAEVEGDTPDLKPARIPIQPARINDAITEDAARSDATSNGGPGGDED